MLLSQYTAYLRKLLGVAGVKGKQVLPTKVAAFDGRRVVSVTLGLGQHAAALVESPA